MGLKKLWRRLRNDCQSAQSAPGNETALLREFLRGTPPDEPQRFYKRTQAGEWLRSAGTQGFLKVKAGSMVGRICLPDHRDR